MKSPFYSAKRLGLRGLLIASALLGVTLASGPAFAAQPAIDGVWSFNGGSVIVAPNATGQLVGTVASPTSFDACVHPVGQAMWTDIQQQSDGAFTAKHQWYHITSGRCTELPTLGPTALRVLTQSDGSRLLRVCFNRPGTAPPTIASTGAPSNVNYACVDSAPLASVPTAAPPLSLSIVLPATGPGICVSRRNFIIHVREPKHDPFISLSVSLGHKVLKYVRRGADITADIDLRGLPKGTYRLTIRATTAAGFHIKGSRTYHTCVPKRR